MIEVGDRVIVTNLIDVGANYLIGNIGIVVGAYKHPSRNIAFVVETDGEDHLFYEGELKKI